MNPIFNPIKSPTKWLGVLLIIFGALQTFSDQVRVLLDPTSYMWYTIVVGVAVAALGALKAGTGGFLSANKTTITGVLLIIFGAVQGFSDQIRDLVSTNAFALFNIVVGIGVAVLGFLNSSTSAEGEVA